MRRSLAIAVAAALVAAAPAAHAVDISSTFGSGDFGSWRTDGFGLPSYRYTVDELHEFAQRLGRVSRRSRPPQSA